MLIATSIHNKLLIGSTFDYIWKLFFHYKILILSIIDWLI